MTRIRRTDEELAEEQRRRRLALQRQARAKLVAAGTNGPLTDPTLGALVGAIDAYLANERKIAATAAQLKAALVEKATGQRPQVQLFEMVHLDERYAEHPDNVGTRTGRYLKKGTGDWDGYARVDFTRAGGRPHWVPISALVPA